MELKKTTHNKIADIPHQSLTKKTRQSNGFVKTVTAEE